MTNNFTNLIPLELIQQKILFVRGQKAMLDRDLAKFYGVTTFNFNKAVLRNLDRFPEDFMFQLSPEEAKEIKKHHDVVSGRGGSRDRSYAFTEQGVAMLSAVLQSKRAIAVSVQIIRSFVKLREILLSNEVLSRRVRVIEAKTNDHAKVIVQIINELHTPPSPTKRKIGFDISRK